MLVLLAVMPILVRFDSVIAPSPLYRRPELCYSFIMNTFDLQIQSSASDGKHAPKDIITMAKERDVATIALTDHDTVGGVEEAVEAGSKVGVRVIPGVEISVEEHGLHILGFGIDEKHESLLTAFQEAHKGRIEGAKKMVENLRQAGFVVEWSDVEKEATGGVVARPHIARAILGRPENKEKLGAISNVHEFIQAHLTDENPNYVKRSHMSAHDAIALIHGAGGVAVWSHPAIHFQEDPDGVEKCLRGLIDGGLDGIEVFNPSHREDDAEYLEGLASRYALLRTGGSDFHEAGDHAYDPKTGLHAARFIGDFETYGFLTQDILPRLEEAIRKLKI